MKTDNIVTVTVDPQLDKLDPAKDQVYKIVQVMGQEISLKWPLNDEGGLELYAEDVAE